MLSKGSLEMIAWCKAGCPLPGDAPRQAERDDKPVKIDRERDAANDPELVSADCVGALHDPDGGLYLPWGPCLSPDDVRRMRAELVGMIEELSGLECWPESLLDDVLGRAIRGPLADLMPNLAHFTERLTEARAESAARDALDRRTWRYDR
jgi:hypothetical protein